jgi:molecular chaperone GrpE
MSSADIDRSDGGVRPEGPVLRGGDPAPGAGTSAVDVADGPNDELVRMTAERDEYLDLARRTRAEFENYRKRVTAQQADLRDRAAADLAAEVVVPTLDVLEAGLMHHPEVVEPIYRAVCQLADGAGLERVDPVGEEFRPEEHEAVSFRDGEDRAGEGDGAHVSVVAEVLRPGYRWRGRLLRPATVAVQGGRR